MLPVLVLEFGHIVGATVDFPQQLIVVINIKLPVGKAHGRGTVAAAAALVENERPVLSTEAIDDCAGGFGNVYFRHNCGFKSLAPQYCGSDSPNFLRGSKAALLAS
jgi:hypothetical protein